MYKKKSDGWLKHYDFILLDMICLQIALWLAYVLRHGNINPYSDILYLNMGIYIELADISVIFFCGAFKNVLKRGYYREFVGAFKQAVLVGAFALLYLFVIQESQNFSRLVLGEMMIIYLVLTYICRLILKKSLRKKMETGGNQALLVVTTSDIASTVIKNMEEKIFSMHKIAGLAIIDKSVIGTNIEGIPVVADIESAPTYVCQEWIDEVFIIPSVDSKYPDALIQKFSETGVTIHINLTKISNVTGHKQFIEKIGDYTVLTTSMNNATSAQLFLKRVMDIVCGLIGCIFTGIVFIFVAPAIYISSPGPIFFSQTRVGKNGKRFKMYKFRSMYMDAEARKAELMKDNKLGDGKMFKLDFDPRVIGNKILPDGTKKTGVGNFIRSTSLDEFPQFFNVLKGDMSIVGTRPPLVGEVNEYELHHRARLAIKPGITGMWQVSGRSDITDFEEVVRLDTKYINEWSIGLDLKILLKTVLVVFKKDGSM